MNEPAPHPHRRQHTLIRLLVALLLLGLGYIGSRTLPLLTPAFGEWEKKVVMSNVDILSYLSSEAALKVNLPPRQQELGDLQERGPDFAPLLQAFTGANIPPEAFWPTRTFTVEVPLGDRSAVLTYHCVIELFCWRVHDVTCGGYAPEADQ